MSDKRWTTIRSFCCIYVAIEVARELEDGWVLLILAVMVIGTVVLEGLEWYRKRLQKRIDTRKVHLN